MGTTAQKLTYLAETKSQLKDTINYTGASISDDTFRQYPRKLYTQYLDILKDTSTLFSGMPKVPEQTGTELTINDTANTRMKLELNPSELIQETTTGKNLFSGDFSQFNSQGGTGTTYGYFKLPTENETYTLTMIAKNDFTPTMFTYLGFTTNGGSAGGKYRWVVFGGQSAITKGTKISVTNLFSGELLNYVSIFSNYATTLKTFVDNFYIQLEKGETATDYEPYTGGISQPNPDYPSEVQVIKGNNSIKIENKNLFNGVYFAGTTNSRAGVTTTVNNDGSITFNGKGTDTYAGYIGLTIPSMPSLNGKKLTISTTSNNSHVGYYLQNPSGYNQTITYDSNQELKVMVQVTSALNYEINETFNIQVELGNSASSYVAHQEQVLPLNLPVENLFDVATWVTKGNNSNYYSYSNGKLSINATDSRTITDFVDGDKIILPNGNYYLSNIGNAIIRIYNQNNNSPVTTNQFEVTLGYIYLKLVSNSVMTCQPQIEPGDKANRYTPYGTIPIEYCKIGDYEDEFIKTSGKNLFDINGEKSDFSAAIYKYEYNLKPNTHYTISSNCPSSNTANIYANSTSSGQKVHINNPQTITSDSNGYFYILVRHASTSEDSGTFNIYQAILNGEYWLQIEEGNSVTDFEPYGNGDWYLNKYIGKVVLDGTESWYQNAGQTLTKTSYYYSLILDNLLKTTNVMSNYFSQKSIYSVDEEGIDIASLTYAGLRIRINTSLANDVTAFKTWLSTYNTTVYYVLATPTHDEITDTTLINQLNAIEQAVSYNGQTNISQTNTGLPFRIKVSAIKNLESVFN